MAIFKGTIEEDWWKYLLALIALIALYKGVTGGLSAAFEKITDPLGLGDKLQEQKEQLQKQIEAKKKFIENLKTPASAKYQLGATYDIAKANAKALATVLYSNMKGASTKENYLKVYGIIKTLTGANDLKLLYKMFGLRENQTLVEWIHNESMPADMKEYMIKKLVAATNL